jgi:hypothetical protein
VGVEKGTNVVISMKFGIQGGRVFNNLRATFFVETRRKAFFNSHAWLRQLGDAQAWNYLMAPKLGSL